MLRRLILATLVASLPLLATIWPEQFSEFKRTTTGPIQVQDQGVWQEYGLEVAETALYQSASGVTFKAEAYRLKDPTNALAVFQWKTPAGAKTSDMRKIAAETSTGAYLILGNYFISFEGRKPAANELEELFAILPRLDQSAFPALIGFLPTQGLIPASPRFLVGPASLQKFEPRIPASVAAFSMGAEAQLARFRSAAGELSLAIFSYPTPHIARERIVEFQKLPGATTKRSGPLVAVTFQAPTAEEAEKLLAKVNYHATLTLNEDPNKKVTNAGDFLISVFTFIGVLFGFTILAGLAHAGIRIAYRKYSGRDSDSDSMLTLDLNRK
ncbi:MAG: hypothetical protein JJE04_19330 [Acidobacteriia bacterium]|nr:hypothetical protein [Terriglobia bacterium]